MHSLSARRLAPCLLVAAIACTTSCSEGGKDSASGFGSFSASAPQPTQDPSDPGTAGETTASTGAAASTGAISGATEEPDPTTTGVDPSTTTGVDPSTTTGMTTMPNTTDPPDPSTTTGVDPSTTTGMTTMPNTTDPPDPPMKDPQPVDGLYESCLMTDTCNANLTDGCFTITDAMTMKVIDSYCTILCTSVNDCGPAPNAPAVQECLLISTNPMQKVCALKCNSVVDCPTGMACTGLALPNNAMGSYCT